MRNLILIASNKQSNNYLSLLGQSTGSPPQGMNQPLYLANFLFSREWLRESKALERSRIIPAAISLSFKASTIFSTKSSSSWLIFKKSMLDVTEQFIVWKIIVQLIVTAFLIISGYILFINELFIILERGKLCERHTVLLKGSIIPLFEIQVRIWYVEHRENQLKRCNYSVFQNIIKTYLLWKGLPWNLFWDLWWILRNRHCPACNVQIGFERWFKQLYIVICIEVC